MELVPQPLSSLLRRAVRESESAGAVFDLPLAKAWRGCALDLAGRFQRQRVATPVGPAAGPHTQLAPNIALAYLGGGRIFELKTVQKNDRLVIPRPCIDATNVAFNVEWSQELRIEQSKDEYAKAAILIAALERLGLPRGLDGATGRSHVFDLSVGYDLAGIQSEPMAGFISGMLDASSTLDRLLQELPAELAGFRDLAIAPRLTSGVTLSTFHGCPSGEIESIARHLMETYHLHTVVKLNPTLLGFDEVQGILHDGLGYTELKLARPNFEKDLAWPEALAMIGRLRAVAQREGVDFGVKLTNTLIVDNHKRFFSDKEMYLSGQPLHVLAMQLLAKLRTALPLLGPGLEPPLVYSFSAGIDQHNVALAAAADLCPVTVCTDLLRPGGYARLPKLLDALAAAMGEVGAGDRETWILRARGEAEAAMGDVVAALATVRGGQRGLSEGDEGKLRLAAERFKDGAGTAAACLAAAGVRAELADRAGPLWVHAAGTRNTRTLAAEALHDPRYGRGKNAKTPKKVGSRLTLFDCVSCDKCVPVCPNDANFTYQVTPVTLEAPTWTVEAGQLVPSVPVPFSIHTAHQLATFADACNACGNCDVFCPEDGGPYLEKPRWFGGEASFLAGAPLDGFCLLGPDVILARLGPERLRLELHRDKAEVSYDDGAVGLRVKVAGHELRILGHTLAGAPAGHQVRGDRVWLLLALLDGVQTTTNAVSSALG